MNAYRLISSDSHVVEPRDLWEAWIEPAFRERAPHVVREEARDQWIADGDVPIGTFGSVGQAGVRFEDRTQITHYGRAEDIPPGGRDPHAHARDLDRDGVHADVIYPSVTLTAYMLPAGDLVSAIFRAYNNWLAEFCRAYPGRLNGVAVLNVDNVDEALEELERTAKLGLVGACIPSAAGVVRYHDPSYEPLWAAAQDLGVPLSLHAVCRGLFHGFDWSLWTTGTPQQRLTLLLAAQEHVLAQEDGKARCLQAVGDLSKAFVLSVPHEDALRIRDDVSFFQAVRAALVKHDMGETQHEEDLDLAVRQIISRAVASEGVLNIFAAAGLEKPGISVLSDDFLAEVRGMPHRNLAVELLQKLLRGELAVRRRKNVVQARSFAEMLEGTLRRHQNRAIEAAQVIEDLIKLARDMREAKARGEQSSGSPKTNSPSTTR